MGRQRQAYLTAWAALQSTRWATTTEAGARAAGPGQQDHPHLNYYHVPNQEKLAAKLVELTGLTNVFFCSTGLEANEAALKLAVSSATTRASKARDRGVRKRPSTAAASPRCRPPAT